MDRDEWRVLNACPKDKGIATDLKNLLDMQLCYFNFLL